jgi:hypothetical protein
MMYGNSDLLLRYVPSPTGRHGGNGSAATGVTVHGAPGGPVGPSRWPGPWPQRKCTALGGPVGLGLELSAGAGAVARAPAVVRVGHCDQKPGGHGPAEARARWTGDAKIPQVTSRVLSAMKRLPPELNT